MKERLTAADLAGAVGSRKARELLGMEPVGGATPKKRSKYNVGPKESRTCDGIVFDSIKEMNRYCELKMMEKSGEIRDLELQPKWDLHVNGIKVGTYSADFSYDETGEIIVEDCKGMKTPIYKIKSKMLKAEYNIEIRET